MTDRLYRNVNAVVLGWIVIGLTVAALVTVAFVVPDVHWGSVLTAGAIGAVVGAAAYGVYVRPRLLVGPTGVTVVNPMRTLRLGWADVELFTAGFQLEIRRRDARTVQVWGVPGRGGLRLRQTVTRADIAAEELNRVLGDRALHQPGVGPQFLPTHRERVALAAAAVIGLVVVVAGALVRV